MTVGADRDHGLGRRAARDCDRALFVRPAAAAASAPRCSRSRSSRRWRCRSPRAAAALSASRHSVRGRRPKTSARSAPSPPAQEPRVTLIALDGATLAYIMPRAAEGRLPQFQPHARRGRGHRPARPRSRRSRIRYGPRSPPACTRRRTACDPRRATTRVAIAAASTCCPTTASPTRWCTSDSCATSPPRPASGPRARCGGSSRTPASATGVVRWPLTHPVAAAARLCRQRPAPPVCRHRYAELDGAVFPSRTAPARHRRRERIVRRGCGYRRCGRVPRRHAGSHGAAPRPGVRARRSSPHRGGAPALSRRPLRRPRRRQSLLPALRAAADAARRPRSGAPALTPRSSTATTLTSTRELGAVLDAVQPGDLVRGDLRLRHGAPQSRQRARSRGSCGESRITGTHERAPDGFLLAYGTSRPARPPPARLARRRDARPCCISSAYPSPATWTASPGATSSPATSPPNARSRSFPATGSRRAVEAIRRIRTRDTVDDRHRIQSRVRSGHDAGVTQRSAF